MSTQYSTHRLTRFVRLKMALPKTRWLDWLLLTLQFWRDHKRLPRQFGGTLNDAWFYINTSNAILDPVRVFVSDKALVKEYIAAKIGAEHNVPTIALLDSLGAARHFDYPDDCVIKPTHMSGEVILRRGGSPVDLDTLRRWFRSNYYETSREANYRHLRRRVIVEPFIFGRDNVEDFKIFCLHGRPVLVQVDFDRYTHHTQNLYKPDWQPLPFAVGCPVGPGFPRPRNLPHLLHYAARLSAEFSLVRIDLYTDGQSVLVGEITNLHQSGRESFVPPEGEAVVSRLFFGDTGFQPMQLEPPPPRV
jgi:TupA-like ATPgrasp